MSGACALMHMYTTAYANDSGMPRLVLLWLHFRHNVAMKVILYSRYWCGCVHGVVVLQTGGAGRERVSEREGGREGASVLIALNVCVLLVSVLCI